MIIIFSATMICLFISVPGNLIIQNQYGLNLFDGNVPLIALIIVLFGFVGMIAGLHPVLKKILQRICFRFNHFQKNRGSIFVSKGIIVTQYAFSIILIASVIIISRQTKFALDHSMGVKEDNTICLESVHNSIQQKFEVLKAELLKHNSIKSVSAMMEPPGGEANDMFRFELEGFQKTDDQKRNLIGVFPCDYSFAKLFNLQFLSGNSFSDVNVDNEGSGEYIINETALHQLNFHNPQDAIGKDFKLISPVQGINIPSGKIIGVVQDFHLSSIKKKVNPLVMFKRDKLWLINFVISYKSGLRKEALSDIQSVWADLFPNYPFNYEQVGGIYRKVYKAELLQMRLLTIFTIISIFISSMGLLGISLLIAQQRVKEIGICKVNGAKVSEVLTMLNKDFVKWVAIAFVIATPIAWYAMNKWLENFAYKTTLSWWIFALAGILALGIALLTVSWQSWKAATRNPVEALRYE